MEVLTQGIAKGIAEGLKIHDKLLDEKFHDHHQLILESLAMNYLLFDLISKDFSEKQLDECRKILLHSKNNKDLPDAFSSAADNLLSRLASRHQAD